MTDFTKWLEDEHPFFFYFTFILLGLVAYFAIMFVLALAVHGFWLPLVVVVLAPLVRVAFLYARFRNDLTR